MLSTPAPPLITDIASATALFATIVGGRVETAAAAFLDPEWRLLGIARFAGEEGTVAPSIRAIVHEALSLDAVALVIAHSHPRGDPAPSVADLAFTRLLARTLYAIDMTLVDHLIFGTGAVVSLRDEGVL